MLNPRLKFIGLNKKDNNMMIPASDFKSTAEEIKLALNKVIAARAGLNEYTNSLIELYDALDSASIYI